MDCHLRRHSTPPAVPALFRGSRRLYVRLEEGESSSAHGAGLCHVFAAGRSLHFCGCLADREITVFWSTRSPTHTHTHTKDGRNNERKRNKVHSEEVAGVVGGLMGAALRWAKDTAVPQQHCKCVGDEAAESP